MPDPSWLVGFHAVLAALEAGRPLELVWLQKGRRDRRLADVEASARSAGVPVRVVPRQRLDEVAGGTVHNGCAARGAPVGLHIVEQLVAPEGRPSRLVLLDSITDPHNLGAVVRSAAGFGVDGVILAGPSAPPLGGAAAKAAAGHLERVPLARVNVAGDAVRQLCEAGYWSYGAAASGADVASVRPTSRLVLCLGGEQRGLRAKTRAAIDEMISIPMAPGVESLNLSVAAGVLLFALSARS